MSFERIPEYTDNFITATALAAGILTGATACSPDFGAELRTATYRYVSADFEAHFQEWGEAGQASYMHEVRENFADGAQWFGVLASTSLIVFINGVRLAKRRRDGRSLNNV